MNQWPRRFFSLMLTCCLVFTGCQSPSQDMAASDTASESRQMDFDTFTETIFAESVSSDALTLHYTLQDPEAYGISLDEITFGRMALDDEAYQSDEKETQRLLEQLRTYEGADLDEDQRITYEVLEYYLETALSASGLEYYSEVLEPSIGLQSQYPIVLCEYEFNSREDIDTYLTLLEDFDDFFQNLIDYEQARSEKGLFMSDAAADATIQECEDFIASPQDNMLIDVFNEKIQAFDGLTDEEKNTYMDRNRSIVLETVVPAYQILIDGLTALKGTGTNDLGLCYYDRGKDYYEYLLRSSVGTDKTPEELLTMLDERMQSAFMTMMLIYQQNPDIYEEWESASYRSDDPNEILEYMKTAIADRFPEAADVDYVTKNVHESLTDSLSPALYLIPQIDDYQNNVIYLNLNDNYGNELFPTVCHEGYPGHLYQTTYFYSQDPNPLRCALAFTGYSEGWASYVEEMSYDYSGMSEDVSQFIAANYALSMCIYAYVDIGIHYNGWDKEQTSQFLSQYLVLDDETLTQIYETVLFSPGNYLNYCIGSLEIQDLRQTAEDTLDDAFDEKAFHQFILDMGPAPFSIIENHMQDWFAAMTD